MTNIAKRDDEIIQKFNSLVRSVLHQNKRKAQKFKYWRATSQDIKHFKGTPFIDTFAYLYTTERDADGYFWAIVYTVTKTNGSEEWIAKHKSHRRSRKKAKAQAYAWYCRRLESLKSRFQKDKSEKEVIAREKKSRRV